VYSESNDVGVERTPALLSVRELVQPNVTSPPVGTRWTKLKLNAWPFEEPASVVDTTACWLSEAETVAAAFRS
jgi:hypothetical protein